MPFRPHTFGSPDRGSSNEGSRYRAARSKSHDKTCECGCRGRYHLRRWTELALRIRRRDPVCYLAGCMHPSECADHIVPVYPGMTDREFYNPANLRGACRQHNLDRGRLAAAAQRLGETAFLEGRAVQDRPPPKNSPGGNFGVMLPLKTPVEVVVRGVELWLADV